MLQLFMGNILELQGQDVTSKGQGQGTGQE